ALDAPSVSGPEPITQANLVPARRDIANLRDNVEKVEIEFPESGTWTVFVAGTHLNSGSQRFSLVMGIPERQVTTLDDGWVAFVSNRVSPSQLFIKNVATGASPVQVTQEPMGVRHPTWSWNGQYFAYLTRN